MKFMPDCELCGKKGAFSKIILDGVNLDVCSGCKFYGKEVQINNIEIKKERINFMRNEDVGSVVEDYCYLIKTKREKLGLSQNELSSKLNEKEGLISKIENGSLKPDLNLAKKIGKFLKVNLIIKEKVPDVVSKLNKSTLTIGDVLNK